MPLSPHTSPEGTSDDPREGYWSRRVGDLAVSVTPPDGPDSKCVWLSVDGKPVIRMPVAQARRAALALLQATGADVDEWVGSPSPEAVLRQMEAARDVYANPFPGHPPWLRARMARLGKTYVAAVNILKELL